MPMKLLQHSLDYLCSRPFFKHTPIYGWSKSWYLTNQVCVCVRPQRIKTCPLPQPLQVQRALLPCSSGHTICSCQGLCWLQDTGRRLRVVAGGRWHGAELIAESQ